MNHPNQVSPTRQRGNAPGHAFTLIELLVVIALLGILASIAVLVLPSIGENARAAEGASQLQGWLNNMRQRSIRDRQPRGVRLLVKSGLVTDAQYIEQPDDLGGSSISAPPPPQPPPAPQEIKTVMFAGNPGLHGGDSFNQNMWLVRPGDYLEVFGGGLMRQISGVGDSSITLVSSLPYEFNGVRQYRIIRQAVTSGDEPLQFPSQVAIDLNTNGAYGNAPFTGLEGRDSSGNLLHLDILFSPSGAVVAPGFSGESINLWVRDISDATTPAPQAYFQGDPTIIAVYMRSGLVAAHPPDQSGPTPYTFVNDGRSSGK